MSISSTLLHAGVTWKQRHTTASTRHHILFPSSSLAVEQFQRWAEGFTYTAASPVPLQASAGGVAAALGRGCDPVLERPSQSRVGRELSSAFEGGLDSCRRALAARDHYRLHYSIARGLCAQLVGTLETDVLSFVSSAVRPNSFSSSPSQASHRA